MNSMSNFVRHLNKWNMSFTINCTTVVHVGHSSPKVNTGLCNFTKLEVKSNVGQLMILIKLPLIGKVKLFLKEADK